MTKTRAALATTLAMLVAIPGGAARAQDYPTRVIQVIVPFAGGSASDVVTRILLNRMATSLGQQFIVDNRPGAGGNTGTAAAIKAAPDGYTLVMSTSGPLAANKSLYRDLGYEPQTAFAPISLACWTIISNASARATSQSLVNAVMFPPTSVCSVPPIVPKIERDRTVMPRTTP